MRTLSIRALLVVLLLAPFFTSTLFADGDAPNEEPDRIEEESERPDFKESLRIMSPGDRGQNFDPADLLKVRTQSFDAPAEKASSLYTRTWSPKGPLNWGGKVEALAVSADAPNLLYAAYGGGGVWKSSDSGTSWVRVTDPQKANYASSIAIAPGHPSTVFIGLGAAYFSMELERGVLRSNNGGQTWTSIGPISDRADAVFGIAVDPSDSNHLIISTEDGAFMTTNGGASWADTLDFPGNTYNGYEHSTQVIGHPSDGQIAWVTHRSGIYKTTDGGATWSSSDQGIGDGGGIVMAISQSQPNVLYAERENVEPNKMDIYRSTNFGDSWTQTTVIDYVHYGLYAMAIGVDPMNSNKVVLANVSWWDSSDGGQNFVNHFWGGGIRTSSAPHADHLAVAWKPGDSSTIYSGNDGGIWRTTDASTTWSKVDNGVQTNLSYNMAVQPGGGRMYLTSGDYTTGQVTNGSEYFQEYPGYEWQFYAIDPHDPNNVYTAEYLQRLVRVDNTTFQKTYIDPCPLPGVQFFDRPFAFDPVTPDVIYVNCLDIRKSTNRGDSWTSISPQLTHQTDYLVNHLAVAPSDPNVIWAIGDTDLSYTRNGGTTWTHRSLPPYPQDLEIDPEDPSVVYVATYFDKVRRYSDWGATEEDLGGNLPNATVRKLILSSDTKRIIALSDAGIFVSDDGGPVWQRLGVDLPRIIYWDIELDGTTLYASGQQGVWTYDLTILPCVAEDDRLCLINDRFELSVDWSDFEGSSGSGKVVPADSANSGLFWFFGPNNWEMLVKVLNGCGLNQHYWVFAAATTTVEYTLHVNDTLTGLSATYHNDLGVAAPTVADTTAIAGCGTSAASVASAASALDSPVAPAGPADTVPLQVAEKAAPGPCVADATTLCLGGGKFELKVTWRDFENHTGNGSVVPDQGTAQSGLFWFFGPNNWEMLVKVLDGCGLNGHHWIFSAATTTVEYQLRVRDTATGAVAVYDNQLGAAARALADTSTLDGCS